MEAQASKTHPAGCVPRNFGPKEMCKLLVEQGDADIMAVDEGGKTAYDLVRMAQHLVLFFGGAIFWACEVCLSQILLRLFL